MMQIKGLWWKVLGIVIFIYVLVGGLTVPLGPGILHVTPSTAKAGDTLQLQLEGYNTHFVSGGSQQCWLKLDSVHMLKAFAVQSDAENQLRADFAIPMSIPFDGAVTPFTLILDNEMDGAFVQPNAVFVTRTDSVSANADQAWVTVDAGDLHAHSGMKFPYRNILHETIRNTFFHVALWFAMFIMLVQGLYFAIKYLRTSTYDYDIRSSAYNSVAIILGVLGLITGSVWAKFTWNTFWTTDVKLNMTAVAMLIYLAYFVLRNSTNDQDRRARISSAYSIFAFLALIPLVFIIPRLTDSLHPGNGGNPALGGEDLDNTLRLFFYPSIIALTLIGNWMATLVIRYERLKDKMLDLQ